VNELGGIRIEVLSSTARSFPRRNEPVRLGVPLPRGACTDAGEAILFDAGGRPHCLQTRALDRWNDGSIRWLLLDFRADHDGTSPVEYELRFADAGSHRPPVAGQLRIDEQGGGFVVDTGAAQFRLLAARRFPFEEVLIGGASVLDASRSGFQLRDSGNRPCVVTTAAIRVEERGALRAGIRVDATIGAPGGERLLELTARLDFLAASASVRVALTLRNPRRAKHPGGFWELGDRGSVSIRDASFVLALPPLVEAAAVRCSSEIGSPLTGFEPDLELFQASSGGEHWRGSNHVNGNGTVPLAFRGYRLRAKEMETAGLRATPVVLLTRGARQLALSVPHFWENFPKAIEATGDQLVLRLFPRQHADLHELQGGEQKTHVFWLAFDRDPISEVPLDWTREPLLAHASPEHYASSGAVPYLIPAADDPDPAYHQLVMPALEGEDTFERKREAVDEYGWRNAGDLYADHEATLDTGTQPLVSHYNNQYDAIAGFALQFMRTGDLRWWHLCSTLAAHVTDIDIYHSDRDKSAFNGGLFWHTAHYTDAGKSSHRSYPRAPKIGGGGPSCEHNYSTGLMLHHFLTGEPFSRDAAIGLAHWVVGMDDGTKTVFRLLAGGDTGVASATGSPLYHGPGRGAGNSVMVLLNGHRLTGDLAFLRKAEVLIRRCVHPRDDIDARDLLNPEPRWSYTVFLYALGKYLDHKAERNEIDETYAYARESLLAYTRWMAAHERPYLDHPEQLEYPNETWVAQELWKNETFLLAAKYSDGELRDRCLERADFFFRYALTTLPDMATRTLTRPMVLLLSHGYMHSYFQRHPPIPAPQSEPGTFGRPAMFEPQKVRAKKRLVILAAGGAVVFLAAAIALLLTL
jgi:hypothetical protein